MANMTEAIHDYYPSTIDLPHYVTNESSTFSLVAQFAVLWGLALGIASIIIRRPRTPVTQSDQFAFIWMCFSKSCHILYFCMEQLLTEENQPDAYIYFLKATSWSTTRP